jgi:hypothetical protein
MIGMAIGNSMTFVKHSILPCAALALACGAEAAVDVNGIKFEDINTVDGNAVLRIWLGDRPVDPSLKPALLGDAH